VATLARIRENTKPRIFLLEAFAICYSFTAAAFRSNPPSLRDDPWGLLRLAIPALTALLVFLLRNAYADPERRTQYASALDVAIALAMAALSQFVLAKIAPELVLPHWAPTQGAMVGWWFLTITRSVFPPGPAIPGRVALGSSASLKEVRCEEIRWKAQEFERTIRRRNIVGYAAGAAISAVFAVPLFVPSIPRARAGSALILAGVAYLMFEIRRGGLPEAVPEEGGLCVYGDVYRRELERQSAWLRRVWYWYFISLIPGCLLLLLGSRVYGYVVLLPILLIAEVHLRVAEKLGYDLAELNRP
jgi:hypothetical protein